MKVNVIRSLVTTKDKNCSEKSIGSDLKDTEEKVTSHQKQTFDVVEHHFWRCLIDSPVRLREYYVTMDDNRAQIK